jgi:NifU-like protein involved in Fe-S cluster formation
MSDSFHELLGEALKISERVSEEILFQHPEDKLPCFKMAANASKPAIEEFKGTRAELSSKKELEKEKYEE